MTACDNYNPPHVEQLHGPDPTAGSDCAICCARMALMFATCGHVQPSPDKIRAQANLDTGPDYSTTITEYQRALNAFDDEAKGKGFGGITANVHERASWNQLYDTLKGEKVWITVYVDYGVLNKKEPSKSGDPNFDGSHAIGVYGYKPKSETDDGIAKVKVWDPLCDGRKSSIPSGPTWWKVSTLQAAADAYAGGGDGTATWCQTPRSKVETDSLNVEGQALPVHSGVTPDSDMP